MKPSIRLLLFCLALPLLTLFQGCASPAQPKAMIAQKLPQVAAARAGGVVVSVTGGSKTNPMWASKIAGEDYQTALVESLKKAGLFQRVDAASGEGPYRLDVRLEVLDQPLFGLNFTVNMRTEWKLTSLKDNRELWHDRIISSHTATLGDAFAAITRLRIANEGAARKNIENGLEKLAAADTRLTEAR